MKLVVLLAVTLASTVAHAGPAHCKDELVTGIAHSVSKDVIVVAIGADEAPLYAFEQIPKERIKVGGTVIAYCMQSGGVSTLSRTSSRLVELLFAREVPEIVQGIVKVEGVAREAGVRTKIGVSSSDPDVDPIGAVVGEHGLRVRAVVIALGGEPIDMVPYNADAARYVTDALAPADIKRIIVDAASKRMEIVVPDSKLAIAKGKRGINVRLAAQLTGWRLDLYRASKYTAAVAKTKKELADVVKKAGLPAEVATKLFAQGWRSPADLAVAKSEELVKVLGIDEPSAAKLIAAARR